MIVAFFKLNSGNAAQAREGLSVFSGIKAWMGFVLTGSLLISCTKNQETTSSEVLDSLFSATDSLTRYSNADSMAVVGHNILYTGRTGQTEIGLLQFSDSSTIVYQKQSQEWQVTDTLEFPVSRVQHVDLNGDSLKDVVIGTGIETVAGNIENLVFLYDPQQQEFVHNEDFDLPNIRYDAASGLVYSAWWAGIARWPGLAHIQTKMAYRIEEDSLVLEKEASYIPDETNGGRLAAVEIYTAKTDKREYYKSIPDTAAIRIFDKAIWDSSQE